MEQKEIVKILKKIKHHVETRQEYLRAGQETYNYTHYLFPDIVDSLKGSSVDCFYKDDLIDEFLGSVVEKLKTLNEHVSKECKN